MFGVVSKPRRVSIYPYIDGKQGSALHIEKSKEYE